MWEDDKRVVRATGAQKIKKQRRTCGHGSAAAQLVPALSINRRKDDCRLADPGELFVRLRLNLEGISIIRDYPANKPIPSIYRLQTGEENLLLLSGARHRYAPVRRGTIYALIPGNTILEHLSLNGSIALIGQ